MIFSLRAKAMAASYPASAWRATPIRIGGQHALEAPGGGGRAVGDDDHPGMDRQADPDSAAVVDRDPRRSVDRVQGER